MQNSTSVPVVPAAVLAQRVLDLWAKSDDERLAQGLNQIVDETTLAVTSIGTTEMEAERHELVRAIAESMGRERLAANGLPEEGPRHRVWRDLLGHLSAGAAASLSVASARIN